MNAVCQDRDGGVWFLSSRFLIGFDGKTWNTFALPKGFVPDPAVTESLAALPNGDIAIATSQARIIVFRRSASAFQSVPHPAGRTIRMFGRRLNGEVLVETLNGMNREGFDIETFDGSAFHSFLDLSKGPGFWDVRSICETQVGDLWFGAVDGLGVYRRGKFRRLTSGDGFDQDGAFAIKEIAPGRLLIGGRNELREYDGTKWTTVGRGLDRVRMITQTPDRTIWIASGTGITRIANGIWIPNDENDGLPSTVSYTVFADRQGRIWAGTMRGLSQYHPDADRDPPHTVVSESFNSRTVAPDGKVRLVFSGVDKWKFTETRRLLFSWSLDDNAWSPFTGESFASPVSLAAGKHKFRVRSMDRNGNIDPNPVSFDFSILRHFYREPIFLVLLLVTAAALSALAHAFAGRHTRLRESRDAAEEGARVKSEFFATMSHEIRTPLNGVIGMTRLLLDTKLTAEQSEFVSTVHSSGAALLSIINDILDFSKIEAGKLVLEEIDFDPFTIIEECADIVAADAHRKGLELILPLRPSAEVLVRGDPNRLRQVLLNLLSNAVKFTADGEVAVTVDSRRPAKSSEEVGLVGFEVRDTGTGIPKEALTRLFQTFSQADSSTTRKFGGTGLGLAISRRLVELMGGRIGVVSEPGNGATFWFTARLGVPKYTGRMDKLLTGIRVLLVDDNAANRHILRLQLEGNGCSVCDFDSARQAAAALDTSSGTGPGFDIVVSDLAMPNDEGSSLIDSIRKIPGCRTIPIVLLTCVAGREHNRDQAVEGILLKPVKEAQLLQCLLRIISAPPRGTEAEENVKPLVEVLPPKRGRILLAEDNLVNQRVAALTLQKLGYDVDVVANGRAAVEASAEQAYGLILMDCQMPEMDGFAATKAIRTRAGGDTIPIIALTANVLSGERERCIAAGMNDYLAKPMNREALAQMLVQWMSDATSAPNDPAVRS